MPDFAEVMKELEKERDIGDDLSPRDMVGRPEQSPNPQEGQRHEDRIEPNSDADAYLSPNDSDESSKHAYLDKEVDKATGTITYYYENGVKSIHHPDPKKNTPGFHKQQAANHRQQAQDSRLFDDKAALSHLTAAHGHDLAGASKERAAQRYKDVGRNVSTWAERVGQRDEDASDLPELDDAGMPKKDKPETPRVRPRRTSSSGPLENLLEKFGSTDSFAGLGSGSSKANSASVPKPSGSSSWPPTSNAPRIDQPTAAAYDGASKKYGSFGANAVPSSEGPASTPVTVPTSYPTPPKVPGKRDVAGAIQKPFEMPKEYPVLKPKKIDKEKVNLESHLDEFKNFMSKDGAIGTVDGVGTVAVSSDPGVFSPTYGDRSPIKQKKKKSGVAKLDQFLRQKNTKVQKFATDVVQGALQDLREYDIMKSTDEKNVYKADGKEAPKAKGSPKPDTQPTELKPAKVASPPSIYKEDNEEFYSLFKNYFEYLDKEQESTDDSRDVEERPDSEETGGSDLD